MAWISGLGAAFKAIFPLCPLEDTSEEKEAALASQAMICWPRWIILSAPSWAGASWIAKTRDA
jgi:hypothetical protein